MIKKMRIALAIILALLLCTGLAACVGIDEIWTNNAGIAAPDKYVESEISLPVNELLAHTQFNEAALTDAIAWAKNELKNIDRKMSAATEKVDFSVYSRDFKAANDKYKLDDFSAAERLYAAILDKCPTHLGARNNYVLALVYQGKYEESLRNSILLGLLHPEYEGNWVNIQIPLYALGYDAGSYTGALKSAGFPSNSSLEAEKDNLTMDDYIARAYAYNRVYSDMEAEMSEAEMASNFAKMQKILEELKAQDPNDPDYTDLLTYLKGLAAINNVILPEQPLPSLNGADNWAKEELLPALEAGVVPASVANAGWKNATSRLVAAEAIVAVIEKATGETMTQIAAENGWNLATGGFSDTNSREVTFLKYAEITNGVGGNRYDPSSNYTRAQMVTMIGRAAEVFFGIKAQGTNPFTDVPDWAAPYVGYAADNGITTGVGGGRFDSNGELQNQHTAVFCIRALNAWK